MSLAVIQENGRIVAGGHSLETARWRPSSLKSGAPSLVLLHEGLGSIGQWKHFPEKLAETVGCEVFAYSRYGYGRSDKLLEKRSPDYMHVEAEQTLPQVLKAAGIERPVLFGHSDGASIAILYAAMYPDAVRGIVTLAPHVLVEDITISGIRDAKQVYETTDFPAKLGRYHDDVDSTFWGWCNAWLSPEFRSWNIEEYLPRIKVPFLVIQGEQDEYATVEQFHRIVAGAPHARTKMLAECAHSPHRDQREEVLRLTKEFVAALSVGGG